MRYATREGNTRVIRRKERVTKITKIIQINKRITGSGRETESERSSRFARGLVDVISLSLINPFNFFFASSFTSLVVVFYLRYSLAPHRFAKYWKKGRKMLESCESLEWLVIFLSFYSSISFFLLAFRDHRIPVSWCPSLCLSGHVSSRRSEDSENFVALLEIEWRFSHGFDKLIWWHHVVVKMVLNWLYFCLNKNLMIFWKDFFRGFMKHQLSDDFNPYVHNQLYPH